MNTALYDLSLLAEYTNGDADAIEDLIGIFYDSFDEAFAELEGQRTDGENDAWSVAAHKLKGAAGYVGADALKHLCAVAQDMHTASAAARTAIYRDIAGQYADLRAALKARVT